MSISRPRARSRTVTIVASAAILTVGLVAAYPANALNDDTIFELDADTFDGAPAGDDWDTIYDTQPAVNNDGDPDTPSTNDQFDHDAFATSGIVADPAPLSIFTQGGSKDYLDIPNWAHKDGSVPDKNDITNAYAAAYADGGDTIIYFGMDRFATEGSANVGFWFVQDPQFGMVPGDPAGTTSGFTGEHTTPIPDPDGSGPEVRVPGDILVLSEFDEGGENPSIKVFEWVGSGGDEGGGALDTVFGGEDGQIADCGDAGHPSAVCAIVNDETDGAVDPLWPYSGKKVQGKATTTIPVAAFFEGGINLTEMFGTTPCISNFVAETRSSFETNAILKDLAVGDFDLCGSLKWLKVDGAGDPLAGATFEVCRVNDLPDTDEDAADTEVDECWTVKDNAADPDTSETSGEPDPATPDEPEANEKADEDDDDGVLLLSALQPGLYTIVETIAPDGYIADDSVKEVQVTQGTVVSEPTVPDGDDDGDAPDPDPFVNVGKYKVIVLTCDMSDSSLVDSTVELDVDADSETDDFKETLTEAPGELSAEDLCALGGAAWDELTPDTYTGSVEVPDVDPFFPELP